MASEPRSDYATHLEDHVGTMPGQPVTPVRKTVAGRRDISREPFSPRRRWVAPRWLRRLLAGLLLIFILPWLLGALAEETQKPTGLATSVLVGPRLAAGPVCIEEAVDLSGSMTAFTPERERAEAELFTFARRELEPTDLISTAHFAGSAQVTLAPSAMDTLTAAPAVPGSLDDGTALAPAIDALVDARAASSGLCVFRALVVITDGLIADPSEAAAALARGGYARAYAVIPADAGWSRPQPLQGPLAGVAVHRFHGPDAGGRVASFLVDAKPLDVVFGEIVGSLTGQRLEQSRQYLP